MTFRPFRCAMFLALLLTGLLAEVAGAADEGSVRVGQSDSGGLMRAWSAVLQEAGIPHEMIFAPNEQKRRWFVRGYIVLDCCSMPEWRARPEERAVQMFSDIFYVTEEHYVFRTGRKVAIQEPDDLMDLTFAVVRGFDYQDEPYLGQVVAGRDIDEMLDLIASGRADIGLLSEADFRHYMARKPRDLELGGLNRRAELRIRVHKSRPDLLERINAAIARLKAEGRFAQLMGAETEGRP